MSQGLSEGFHVYALKAFLFFGQRLRPQYVGLASKFILLSARQPWAECHKMYSIWADGAGRLILTHGRTLYPPKAMCERGAAPKIQVMGSSFRI